jgi:hypothetical protein
VIGVALDADLGQAWVHLDGVWQIQGDPATGTLGHGLGIPTGSPIYPCINISQGDVYTANFGQSSFVYPVPEGFHAGVF